MTPKELIREYETREGGKIREVGLIAYRYSMTLDLTAGQE
jgi:hypothetical protein